MCSFIFVMVPSHGGRYAVCVCVHPYTWPHLNSDVGLEEGEY